MSAVAIDRAPASAGADRHAAWLARWWPLLALTLLAAVLRLSTLDLQSFWGDEAFTPVHVLRPSLFATLHGVARTEDTPPLWYLLAWLDSRVLGTGEVALRLPSALAGIATVPVAWAIGRELAGRRAALVCAALVAVNPISVWYSQEARSYALYMLAAAVAMLCFLRVQRKPTRGRVAAFALAGALALATHYFAAFLLVPMVVWLLWDRRTRAPAAPAIAVLVLVSAALAPLIITQAGHNFVQWIGEWPLSSRLAELAHYYLTGYYGKQLGHKVELLVALPLVVGLGLGAWRMRQQRSSLRPALVPLSIAASGLLLPLVLVALGHDYLAPRNVVGAMVPLTALIAVVMTWPGMGRTGLALAAIVAVAFLAMSLDVDLKPSLQRENWRDLAAVVAHGTQLRAITTLHGFGSSTLAYYLPRMQLLHPGESIALREIDETGTLDALATTPPAPAPGFRLLSKTQVDGLVAYRFVSTAPRRISQAALAAAGFALAGGEANVVLPAGARALPVGAGAGGQA